MNPAYRIPKGKFPIVDRFISQETEANTPITEMVVNSLITNLDDGSAACRRNQTIDGAGIAWDGGYGIATVEVSQTAARAGGRPNSAPDLGRFSWRQWTLHRSRRPRPGSYTVMARATNRIGASQTFELIFNPAGYHNNVVQRIDIQGGLRGMP